MRGKEGGVKVYSGVVGDFRRKEEKVEERVIVRREAQNLSRYKKKSGGGEIPQKDNWMCVMFCQVTAVGRWPIGSCPQIVPSR